MRSTPFVRPSMTFPLPSPYPPDVDAHIWRGYRPVRGQLSLGLLMRRADEAEQWAARVLNLLIADPALKIDVVFRAAGLKTSSKASVPSQPRFGAGNPAFSKPVSAPFEMVPLAVRPACCFIDVEYDVERQTFTEEARETIRKRSLDVLLWLDSHLFQGDCNGLARLGVWAFYFGDPKKPFAQPPSKDLCIVALQRHSERFENGELLAWHAGPTGTSQAFTEIVNRMAAPMLIRNLLDALECPGRLGERAGSAEALALSKIPAPLRSRFGVNEWTSSPRPAHGLGVWIRHHMRRREQSFVALRRKDKAANWPFNIGGFVELEQPPGSRYADPFPIEREGKHWLFVQEIPPGTSKGRITCVEILDTGHPGKPRVAIDEPYHLAYPCVFEHEGDCFLLPDTAANNTVSLYRVIQFPHRWELVSYLAEGKAVSGTTPLFLDGLWYFFTSTKEIGRETFLFYSEKLEGPWRYHPANPICSDACRARAAGALFYRGGKLIRPSRDCSPGEGRSIAFNEVTLLSPGEYADRVVERISSDWHPNLLETHTYNSDGMYEAISGMRFER
jgi:hypothetical protein